MIETDAPYLTPRNMPRFNKVRRNEAMLLPFVVKKLAECMDISVSVLINRLCHLATDRALRTGIRYE
jgi:Tat protein secretion system quality control protein TatD with DNase activity